jgi:hypothetical protein
MPNDENRVFFDGPELSDQSRMKKIKIKERVEDIKELGRMTVTNPRQYTLPDVIRTDEGTYHSASAKQNNKL